MERQSAKDTWQWAFSPTLWPESGYKALMIQQARHTMERQTKKGFLLKKKKAYFDYLVLAVKKHCLSEIWLKYV